MDLTKVSPDSERARFLVDNIKQKTINSLFYLVEHCEEKLELDLSCHKGDLVDLKNKRCNGLLYAFHESLSSAMLDEKTMLVIEMLENVNIQHCFYHGLCIQPLGASEYNELENKIIYDTAQKSHDELYAKQYDCRAPNNENFIKSKNAIITALKHIKQLDFACYLEFYELISNIVICKSNVINAGTCFNTFGFLYVRELSENEHWLKYFENLVHEAGHHYLYSVLACDKLIDSKYGDQYFYSPLRKEKRPLNGIYQAMFVLARTIRVFNRLKESDIHQHLVSKIRTYYNNAKNPSSFETKFIDTYDILKDHAHLTRVGQSILDECYQMADI